MSFSVHVPSALDPLRMKARQKSVTVISSVSFSLQFGNVPTPLYETLPVHFILFIDTGSMVMAATGALGSQSPFLILLAIDQS